VAKARSAAHRQVMDESPKTITRGWLIALIGIALLAVLYSAYVSLPPRLAESGRSAATARITESGTIRCDQSRHVTPSPRGPLRV